MMGNSRFYLTMTIAIFISQIIDGTSASTRQKQTKTSAPLFVTSLLRREGESRIFEKHHTSGLHVCWIWGKWEKQHSGGLKPSTPTTFNMLNSSTIKFQTNFDTLADFSWFWLILLLPGNHTCCFGPADMASRRSLPQVLFLLWLISSKIASPPGTESSGSGRWLLGISVIKSGRAGKPPFFENWGAKRASASCQTSWGRDDASRDEAQLPDMASASY